MIQKITIENFKVFDFIEIEGFSQINVFVGANDSGKTSLLEAIFLSLAPSNPDLLFRTLFFRNFPTNASNIDSIFHNFNHKNPIKITTQDNQNIPFELQISDTSSQNKPMDLQQKMEMDFSSNQIISELTFISNINHQRAIVKSDFIRNANQMSIPQNYPHKLGTFIPIENLLLNDSLAININNIRKNKATQIFIKYLQIFNPHIVDIEVNGVSVYVNLNNKSKLLDIHLMGTGFKKYAIILASIFEVLTRKGESDCFYVCVDEIENGLYFKNCEKLLESLIALGKEMNIQYFFSTHSLEFLEILRKVSEKIEFKEQAIFQIKETKKGIKAYRYSFEQSPYFDIEQLDPRD